MQGRGEQLWGDGEVARGAQRGFGAKPCPGRSPVLDRDHVPQGGTAGRGSAPDRGHHACREQDPQALTRGRAS